MNPKKCLSAAALGALLGLTLGYPQTALDACRQAGTLWAFRVAPALFPYLVLSRLLADLLPHPALTLPLALLGGSPAGAALLASRPTPDPRRRQTAAALCATASPLYLLGALEGGPTLLLAHWTGAGLAALAVFAGLRRPAPPSAPPLLVPRRSAPVTEVLAEASGAMVTVCGCMAFYAVLAALAARLLPLSAPTVAGLSAVLEMAGGCARIQALALTPSLERALLCATVSFGGLSVFTQNAVFLRRAGVNLRVQLLAKCLHALFSFGLCLLFGAIFPSRS